MLQSRQDEFVQSQLHVEQSILYFRKLALQDVRHVISSIYGVSRVGKMLLHAESDNTHLHTTLDESL